MGSVISITNAERPATAGIPAVRRFHPSSNGAGRSDPPAVPTAPCVTSTPLVLEISCDACPQQASSHCQDCLVTHLLESPSVRRRRAETPTDSVDVPAGETRPLALVRCIRWGA